MLAVNLALGTVDVKIKIPSVENYVKIKIPSVENYVKIKIPSVENYVKIKIPSVENPELSNVLSFLSLK